MNIDMPAPFIRGLSRGVCMLAIILGLFLLIMSCTEPQGAALTLDGKTPNANPAVSEQQNTEPPALTLDGKTPNANPTVPEQQSTEPPAADAIPTPGDNSIQHALPEPAHYGAATAPLEERIHFSDTIVRATLLSTTDGQLRFKSIEYLKGSGTTEFAIHTATTERNPAWDNREAVLFLNKIPSGLSASDMGLTDANSQFSFTETAEYYKGDLPHGYTVDSRNPVWLPAIDLPDADNALDNVAKQNTTARAFMVGPKPSTNDSPVAISLTDLRSKIAWMDGKGSTDGYDTCIGFALNYLQWHRDWETYYGKAWTPRTLTMDIQSGSSQGTIIANTNRHNDAGYSRFWITGPDAAFFKSENIDNDTDPTNGYNNLITAKRPLVHGTYTFFDHRVHYDYTPCNFTPEKTYLKQIVTVSAPADTAHEAFFDPVTIGQAIGADARDGTLTPTSFSLDEGHSTSTLRKITWQQRQVMMEFEPSRALAGHHADFISIDGSTALRLDFDDASVVATGQKHVMAWNVCKQPWQSGDLLMLRINKSNDNLTGVTNDGPCPVSTPTPTATPTPTPTPTATPAPTPTPTPANPCVAPLRFTPGFGGSNAVVQEAWGSDCASTHRAGSYARFYTFTLSEETAIRIDLVGSGGEDAYLFLLDGAGTDGAVNAENNDRLPNDPHSLIRKTLPAGAYTVEATTNQRARTGNFFLIVNK